MQTIHTDAMRKPTVDRYFRTLCGHLVKERYLQRINIQRLTNCRQCLEIEAELRGNK